MADIQEVFQPYDQFILFGDSITQMGSNQELGFAFLAALQECKSLFSPRVKSILIKHKPTAGDWM
jgi:hypothetical protein